MTLATLALWGALAATPVAEIGPVPPAGTNAEVLAWTQEIYTAMEAGDFALARQISARLPRKKLTVQYDDSGLAAEYRPKYRKAVEAGLDAWRRVLPELELSFGPSRDILINYTETLPADEGTGVPQGAAFFLSRDPSEPQVEAVLAHYRLSPPQPSESEMITGETAHAIGRALGLARSARPGGAMGRSDLNARVRVQVLSQEWQTVRRLIALSDQLRAAAAEGKVLVAPRPIMRSDTMEVQFDPQMQGAMVPFSFQLSNPGNAPLSVVISPDCGCFTLGEGQAQRGIEIAPGQTSLIQGQIDTTNFPGPFRKAIYLYSNDPDAPLRRIPFTSFVRPAVRFIHAKPQDVTVLSGPNEEVEIFMAIDPEAKLTVTKIEALGAGLSVKYEPWRGRIADPTLGESEPLERAGYRIRLNTGSMLPAGRSPIGLNVTTTSAAFRIIPYTFYVQQGIAPSPVAVVFGAIPSGLPAQGWVILTRPGQPFKVTSVRTDTEYFEAKLGPSNERGDIRIDVRYKGGAPAGAVRGSVIASTDDPKQPEVRIPIQAVIQ